MYNNIIFWEPILWSTFFLFNVSATVNFNYILLQLCLLGYCIFFFGIIGLIIRRISLIYTLISVELMFLGLNIVFLFLGYLLSQPFLQIIVFVLLILSACEAAILLSIIFTFYRINQTTDLNLLKFLKY